MGVCIVLCTRVLNILSVTLEIMFMFVLFKGVRLDACGKVCVCVLCVCVCVCVCFQAERVIGLSVNHPKASQGWPRVHWLGC